MRQFKHDCYNCHSLGTVTLNEAYNGSTKLDLYVCPNGNSNPIHHSLIARYGDDGPEYMSTNPTLLFGSLFSTETDHKQFKKSIDELYMIIFTRWRSWLHGNVSEYIFVNAMYECFKSTVERSTHLYRLKSDWGVYPPTRKLTEAEWNSLQNKK